MALGTHNFQDTRVWLSTSHITPSSVGQLLNCSIVTGSSQGLGFSIVSHILNKGDRVVATSRSLSSLQQLQSRYPSSQLLVLALDVSKSDQVKEVFERTEKEFGRLDVVVNNAGFAVNGEIESTPDDVARNLMDVLFWGAVNIMREVSTSTTDFISPISAKEAQLLFSGHSVLQRRQSARTRRQDIQYEFSMRRCWHAGHRFLCRCQIWCVAVIS